MGRHTSTTLSVLNVNNGRNNGVVAQVNNLRAVIIYFFSLVHSDRIFFVSGSYSKLARTATTEFYYGQ